MELSFAVFLKAWRTGRPYLGVMSEETIAGGIGVITRKLFVVFNHFTVPGLTQVCFGLLGAHGIYFTGFFKRVFLREVGICSAGRNCTKMSDDSTIKK